MTGRRLEKTKRLAGAVLVTFYIAAATMGLGSSAAFGDATGQVFNAAVNYSPDGGPFNMAEEVLGAGPATFGTTGVFATTSEGIGLVLATSEQDLGGNVHELSFNYTAVDSAGAPSAFTSTLPVDVLEWALDGLSWSGNTPFEILTDQSNLYLLNGQLLGGTPDLFVGQTGTELKIAVPLFAGGANLTDFSIGRFEFIVQVQEVPEPGGLAIIAAGVLMLLRRRLYV